MLAKVKDDSARIRKYQQIFINIDKMMQRAADVASKGNVTRYKKTSSLNLTEGD